jgi:hypothetical protein
LIDASGVEPVAVLASAVVEAVVAVDEFAFDTDSRSDEGVVGIEKIS